MRPRRARSPRLSRSPVKLADPPADRLLAPSRLSRRLSTFLDQPIPLLLRSDAVFGVKTSLIVDTELVTDDARARQLGFKHGPYSYLNKDYVLLTTGQAEEAKRASLANYYKSIQQ